MAVAPNWKKVDADRLPPGLGELALTLNSFGDEVVGALSKGLTFRENFSAQVVTLEVSPRSEWTVLAQSDFLNGWKRYTASDGFSIPRYRKVGDTVEIFGWLASGTTGSDDTHAAFILPVGYRPDATYSFPATQTTSGTPGMLEVRVAPNGAVRPALPAGTTPTYVSLDGIRFPALDPVPVVPPGYPLKFKSELKSQPIGLLVLDAFERGSQGRPVSAPISIDWETQGDQVVVKNVTGLRSGHNYKLRLLIFTG